VTALHAPENALGPTEPLPFAARMSINSRSNMEFSLADSWARRTPVTVPAPPKFCIIGAGAIGGMIAALLSRAGATVSVVARGPTLAALKRHGLRLIIDGEISQASIRVGEDPSKLGVQDYVIIAVKAPSLPEVARQVSPLLGSDTAVVTAMNGVPWWFFLNAKGMLAGHQLNSIDPGGTIGQAIPVRRVVGCVVHTAASVDEPGIIRHSSGRQLLVGEPDNRLTARLARLADWLCRAGFDCRESTNIQGDIWFKLWGNLSMNPISLLTSATSDRILGDPLVRRLCVSMMEEAARIGAMLGLPGGGSIENMMGRIRALGSFKMSMLQDVERDRPIELDALLTVTHDIGLLAGVPTPFIDSVLGLARLRAASLGLVARAA
jgi:2-dehydropantoate 2-reductase